MSHEFETTAPTAVEIAESYQRSEFLYADYPTYGVDRLLLENRDVLSYRAKLYDNQQPKSGPDGIKELFAERIKAMPPEEEEDWDRGFNDHDHELYWLMEQWRDNYLLPRTVPLTETAEVDAWKIFALGKNITDDMIKERRESAFSFEQPQLLVDDTHLVPGLWGGGAASLVVPPGVKLTGPRGHSAILDTNSSEQVNQYSMLPPIGAGVLEILRLDGDIAQSQGSIRKDIARSALSGL